MSSEVQEKLAAAAATLRASREQLRLLEGRAIGLRQELQRLRRDLEADDGLAPLPEEWGQRVPTRPLAMALGPDVSAATETVDYDDPDDDGPPLVAEEITRAP
jgi:hypothetical protein